jgi:hypothetical protein
MSILGPLKSLTHIAGQAFAASLHCAVHARTAQVSRFDTGKFAQAGKDAGRQFADELAEREAESEVTEPPSRRESPDPCSICGGDEIVGGATHLIDCPIGGISNINHGFLSWPPPQSGDAERLNYIVGLLEDIRGLTLTVFNNSSAAPTPTPGVAAERPDASHPEPGASGQPTFPDWCAAEMNQVADILLTCDSMFALGYANDLRRAAQERAAGEAEAADPTLGNDPGSIHNRRMRQLIDEDRK